MIGGALMQPMLRDKPKVDLTTAEGDPHQEGTREFSTRMNRWASEVIVAIIEMATCFALLLW